MTMAFLHDSTIADMLESSSKAKTTQDYTQYERDPYCQLCDGTDGKILECRLDSCTVTFHEKCKNDKLQDKNTDFRGVAMNDDQIVCLCADHTKDHLITLSVLPKCCFEKCEFDITSTTILHPCPTRGCSNLIHKTC